MKKTVKNYENYIITQYNDFIAELSNLENELKLYKKTSGDDDEVLKEIILERNSVLTRVETLKTIICDLDIQIA